MDQKAAAEYFHLSFLSLLERKLDQRLFAVKGGCNLRFFFQSIRYSEDIDIDVVTIAVATLKKKIDDILEGGPFANLLRMRGLTLEEWSAPKQTETVQRWKARLTHAGSGFSVPTKIEFSRRGLDSGIAAEPVAPLILANYGLSQINVPHYTGETAIRQKLNALIFRTETQARDVFDLDWLCGRTGGGKVFRLAGEDAEKAIDHALSISYDDFRAQVLAYLEPAQAAAYDEARWNRMVEDLVRRLEGRRA